MRFSLLRCLASLFLLTASCLAAQGGSPAAPGVAGTLELVETVPAETAMDHGWPKTGETWLAMIGAAESTLDLAHFYANTQEGSRLDAVIAAIEAAADRGVVVRFLAGERFYETYPEILDRFDQKAGIEVRRVDLREITDGVQHAKYMLVDGEDVFVGSPNFDWRSLEHIVELGVRLHSREVAATFGDIFAWDWALAGGATVSELPEPKQRFTWPQEIAFGDSTVLVTPVASPKGLLPDPALWELPLMVAWIDEATTSVDLEFLTYKAIDRSGAYSPALETALRSAAARGVQVRLLVAHWGTGRGTIEGLQSLACLPGIDVRFATIPEASSGFEPFSRVHHAKQIVVDRKRAWIGTSNAQGDYFEKSRNVGLLLEGASVGEELAGFFESYWNAPFTQPVVPGQAYPAPRVAR